MKKGLKAFETSIYTHVLISCKFSYYYNNYTILLEYF